MSKSGLKLFQGLLRTLTLSGPVANHANVVHKAPTQIRHYLRTTLRAAAVQAPLKSRVVSGTSSRVLCRFQQGTLLTRTRVGAFPRSAGGGYSMGGKRAFSGATPHPSEIIKQTSNAMRAFLELRKSVQPDVSPESIRLEAASKETHIGSQLVFDMRPPYAPTQTCLSRDLVEEFATVVESWKSSITSIAQQLGMLYERVGELPMDRDGSTIRITFAGKDTESVNRLLNDAGISHGLLQEFSPVGPSGFTMPTAKMKHGACVGKQGQVSTAHSNLTRLAAVSTDTSETDSPWGLPMTPQASVSDPWSTWSTPSTFDTWGLPLTPDGSSHSSGHPTLLTV